MTQTADEWRDRVAAAVCGVKLVEGPGGTCFFRSMLGMMALAHLGIKSRLGSAIYRVGPHEIYDCVAFCGPGNMAAVPNMFHMWLQADGHIVDFNSGDWRTTTHIDALPTSSPFLEGDGKVPPITWTIDPPDYIWCPARN